jgi:TorA maturation chaperone TorD
MTDIAYRTTTTDIAVQSAFLSRLFAWCTHFAEGVREGQAIAARYHALSRLSTPDLARRGLNRQVIARAALTGY